MNYIVSNLKRSCFPRHGPFKYQSDRINWDDTWWEFPSHWKTSYITHARSTRKAYSSQLQLNPTRVSQKAGESVLFQVTHLNTGGCCYVWETWKKEPGLSSGWNTGTMREVHLQKTSLRNTEALPSTKRQSQTNTHSHTQWPSSLTLYRDRFLPCPVTIGRLTCTHTHTTVQFCV